MGSTLLLLLYSFVDTSEFVDLKNNKIAKKQRFQRRSRQRLVCLDVRVLIRGHNTPRTMQYYSYVPLQEKRQDFTAKYCERYIIH